MKALLAVLFSATIFLPHSGFTSEDVTKTRMLGDLDFIKNTFNTQYAPAEWKAAYQGWYLDSEIDKAKAEILNMENPSVKDFQIVVKNFFNSVQDYHVGVYFYSTESATLPFKIKGAGGRYFFTYIDRAKLSPVVYPIKEGDELVSIDGVPIDAAIAEFKREEIGKGDNPTSQALAEALFPFRTGTNGHQVPKGPVMVSVRPKGSNKIHTYQMIWHYIPEQFKNIAPLKQKPHAHMAQVKNKKEASKKPFNQHPVFQKKLLSQYFYQFKTDDPRRSFEDIGSRRSFIPALGKKIWESDPFCPFYAYLFERSDQKKIGFVRIPHYMPTGDELGEFKDIISFFQENSDALIIDQINNPGGSLFYLYALASMLTDQPLYAPKHRMSITQKEIALAFEIIPVLESVQSDTEAEEVLGDAMDGNLVTYQMAQFFLNYFRFLVDQWNSGHTFTAPTYLWGIDHINPHPEVQYTKPILLVVNSLDFSGGDFFPAIMQDNKRVKVFGSRTAGAGGFVLNTEFPNLFGIDYFHYTASLAERENNELIENIGVSPDISYEIGVEDLQNNYSQYAASILKAVDELLSQ